MDKFKFGSFILITVFCGLLLGACKSSNQPADPNATPTPIQGQTVRNQGNGVYDLYDPELIAESNDKKIILFFYSDICAECRALQNDIQSNVTQIPEDLIIMKVDIDARIDLKEKYDVEENILVEVDKEENEIKKLGAKKSLAEIIKAL